MFDFLPPSPARPGRRWLAGLVLCSLVVQLAAGCGRGGPASPQGDPRAAQRAATAESRQAQPQGRGQNEPPPSLLSSLDLALVYQFILEGFVEPVQPGTLVEAASSGVRETVQQDGGLPIVSAPLDILPLPSGDGEREWSAFSTAYDAVIQRYPDWSLQARPDYLAVRKMVDALGDGHSGFRTAEQVRRNAETSYSGIGVRVAKPEPNGPPVVKDVFRSSPAAAAGLRSGDRIVGVGDRQVAQLPIGEVVDLIRGPQNSEVVLQIERSSAPAPLTLRVTRRPVTAPEAEGEVLEGTIGYIRLFGFGSTAAERVGSLLLEQGRQGAKAWILDLRGNPGGNLETAGKVAGYFMEPRPIGIAVDRDGQRQPILAEQRPLRLTSGVPLAVLIDGESGSASEVLAASFKEYQLATLIGQKTAGSVGIAVSRSLSDGSEVLITVSKLVTPSGGQIDKLGVQPDESVTLAARDLESGRDPQRERAVQVLRQRLGAS